MRRFLSCLSYAQRNFIGGVGLKSTRWLLPAEPRTLTERCMTRTKPNLRSFYLEVGNLDPQNAQGWSRPTRTFLSSCQALFERAKPLIGAATQWQFSRNLPRALASGTQDLQPGVTARCSFARVSVARGEVLFGASRRWRGRKARRILQPGDMRSFLRRAICSPARCSERVGVGKGAWARGLQSGVVAMCSSARVGGGEGAGAWGFINFGRPGALLGSSVACGSGCG